MIPVYIRDAKKQEKAAPTTIEFQASGEGAGTWSPATDKYSEKVQAVRLTRFDGAATIKFDTPQRVKLSAADWADQFSVRSTCRNVVVDLLNNGDKGFFRTLDEGRRLVSRVAVSCSDRRPHISVQCCPPRTNHMATTPLVCESQARLTLAHLVRHRHATSPAPHPC